MDLIQIEHFPITFIHVIIYDSKQTYSLRAVGAQKMPNLQHHCGWLEFLAFPRQIQHV